MMKSASKGLLFHILAFQAMASTDFSVSATNFQRLNDPQNEIAANNWLGFKIENRYKSSDWEGTFKASGQYAPNNKSLFYSLQEAHFDYKGKNALFWVGRKSLNWNQSEQFWTMNTINPQRAFSFMENEREGLVGMSMKGNFNGFLVEGMFSPFYIPQMNPDYDISEPGTIATKSEWLRTPPKTVLYNNIDTPVHYTIERPRVSDILLQESFAFNVGYEWGTGQVNTYALYKPENKIRINATGRYDLDNHVAYVRAKPFVNYHNVYGASLRQKVDRFTFGLGYEVDEPRRGNDPTFIFDIADFKPVYIKRSYARFYAKYDSDTFNAGLYLLEMVDEQGSSPEEFFSETSMWSNALGFDLEYRLNDHFSYYMNFRHDFKWGDTLSRNELKYRFNKYAGLLIGLELLESPDDKSFWSYFRSNDKFYSTLSLHF